MKPTITIPAKLINVRPPLSVLPVYVGDFRLGYIVWTMKGFLGDMRLKEIMNYAPHKPFYLGISADEATTLLQTELDLLDFPSQYTKITYWERKNLNETQGH